MCMTYEDLEEQEIEAKKYFLIRNAQAIQPGIGALALASLFAKMALGCINEAETQCSYRYNMRTIKRLSNSNESDEWEAELDTFGTNSEIQTYISHLQKAPEYYSPSKQALTDFIQSRMSA